MSALPPAEVLYLDHAATSFPKPPAVLAAVQHWFTSVGVSEGRGDGLACQVARREVADARRRLGRLVGCTADRVAFVSGATEGLNLALRALLRPGDTVLATAYEHSSVVRPLRALEVERRLQVVEAVPAGDGALEPEAIRDLLQRHRPDLFVFTHASNVTGAVFDAAAFAALAAQHGCRTVLDASQTAGWLPIDAGADVVVASCHKALLAPPGLGFVAVREGVDLPSQKQGGTGSSRALQTHPREWPAAFEAGTPNTPAIFGLAAALRWADEAPPGPRLTAALGTIDEVAARLARTAGVRLLLPPPGPRLPVLSFVHERFDPAEIGLLLASAGVAVRTGHHCAPLLHAHLGTAAAGTVRVSPGGPLSAAEWQRLDTALAALR